MSSSTTAAAPRRKLGVVGWFLTSLLVLLAVLSAIAAYIVWPTSQSVRSQQTDAPPTASLPTESLSHDFVAQALPTNLTVTNGDGDVLLDQPVVKAVRVAVGSGRYNLDPPGDTVAMFDDSLVPWAVRPGSAAATAVLVCHADATKGSRRTACNSLGKVGLPSTTDGYQAVMRLPGGTLQYKLAGIHPVPKEQQFARWKSMSGVSGRLLISMCALDSSTGTLRNTTTTAVWEFALVSSKAS